jgi:hypothetical protein
MKSGPGRGVGLKGLGSQDGTDEVGGQSSGTATTGSGTVTGKPTTTSKGAAAGQLQPMDTRPLILGLIVVSLSAAGGLLL